MEQKRMLLSALSVGVGVGVGLGLASGQSVSKWGASGSSMEGVTGEQIVQELMRLVVDGKQSKITFDEFPYYLSERTRMLLTSAAFVHLKNSDISKHTRNLSPASRTILLSGPAELYQQMLAKALANFFEAKLLLLDIPDFSLKMQHKYGYGKKETAFKRSISEMTLERMSSLFGSFSPLSSKEEAKATLRRQSSGMEGSSNAPLRRNASAASDMSSVSSLSAPTNAASLNRSSSWCFDEKHFLQSLYKVLVSMSETGSVILYLRDVDKLLLQSQRLYNLFDKLLKKLSGSVVILGSRMLEQGDDCRDVDERLSMLFPYNIEIKAPEEENHLVNWKAQLEEDMKTLKFQDNKNHIAEVLAANDLDCDDLGSICHADTVVLSNYIEEIVVSAISYHLMNNKDPEYRNGKLVISSQSLSHGLNIFQEGKSSGKDTLKLETNADSSEESDGGEPVTAKTESKTENSASESKSEIEKSVPVVKKDSENAPSAKVEVPPDNEFEKRLRPEVIPANEIGVTFADIGALDETKESLQELVMLPFVIEEIVDDEKPTNGNDRAKQLKKKGQSSNFERQIVVKNGAGVSVLESEDEDGFMISSSRKSKGTSQDSQVGADEETDKKTSENSEKKKAKDISDDGTGKKRKVKSVDQDDQPEKKKKKKKKKKQKENGERGQVDKVVTSNETEDLSEGENQQELKSHKRNQKDLDNDADNVPDENHSEKKKKKQKKKKKAEGSEGDRKTDQTVSPMQEQTAAKPSQVRSFPNGLVIEEVAMGKPDGKRASQGKQVSVHYIGKLKNGKIFDSNVGRAPFKFRLGIGQVIKGWDVGVNGMRVGDKRRLTIPPSMGYGAKGAGGKIPPNSWLVFDVELVDVR